MFAGSTAVGDGAGRWLAGVAHSLREGGTPPLHRFGDIGRFAVTAETVFLMENGEWKIESCGRFADANRF